MQLAATRALPYVVPGAPVRGWPQDNLQHPQRTPAVLHVDGLTCFVPGCGRVARMCCRCVGGVLVALTLCSLAASKPVAAVCNKYPSEVSVWRVTGSIMWEVVHQQLQVCADETVFDVHMSQAARKWPCMLCFWLLSLQDSGVGVCTLRLLYKQPGGVTDTYTWSPTYQQHQVFAAVQHADMATCRRRNGVVPPVTLPATSGSPSGDGLSR
jgi:hypothetical protein